LRVIPFARFIEHIESLLLILQTCVFYLSLQELDIYIDTKFLRIFMA